LCRGSPRRRKASVAGAAPSGRGMRRGTSAGPTMRAAEPIGAVPPSGRGGVRRLTRLGLIGIACAAGLAPPPAAEAAGAAPEAGERAAEVALGLLRLKAQERSGREALDWLDRLSSLITAGVRAGGQDRAAAVRVAIERDAVGSDLIALEADAGALGRELAELTGLGEAVLPRVVEPEAGDDAAPSPADSSALLAWAESAPEVMALRSEEAGERRAP